LQTRFLYPFFLDRLDTAKMRQALRALQDATLAGCAGLWTCAVPLALYTDEVLQHVREYLFPDSQLSSTAPRDAVLPQNGATRVDRITCRYLKIPWTMLDGKTGKTAPNPQVQAWFHRTVLQLPGTPTLERTLPVHLLPDVAIELFLAPPGVGLLSIGVTPGRLLSLEEALTFNYQLAQWRHWAVRTLYNYNPKDDPAAAAQLPEQDRLRLPDSPPASAPLGVRLRSRGGTFDLPELVRELLGPLTDFGFKPALNQELFSVYTIARFGAQVDFGHEEHREELASFLSALAQIEEPAHAGAPVGTVGTVTMLNNTKHWLAVGQLGAAHLIADQPPRLGQTEEGDPFQRLPRVRDKYFIAYLVALLQRLTLNRVIDEASTLAFAPTSRVAETLNRIQTSLLQFAVGGYFTQVHSRHALHRFYRTAQEGLDVPDAWEQVHRTIAEADVQHARWRQEQMAAGMHENLAKTTQVADNLAQVADSMDENLQIVAHVQTMVEWIEAFIVSVYTAHLWHMVTHDNDGLLHWVETHLGISRDWFVHGGALLLAVGSLCIMLAILWKRNRLHAKQKQTMAPRQEGKHANTTPSLPGKG
jgi:hypothetical protein